jgi:hypothetical protein
MATPDDEAAPAQPRRRRRRGVLARFARIGGLAGEAGQAALALLRAETRLARAAVPHAIVWLVVVVLFAVLLVGSLWGALLLALVHLTGSVGVALAWLAVASALVFGVAVWMLVRAIKAASYAQTRRRIAQWLERSEPHDVETDAREN